MVLRQAVHKWLSRDEQRAVLSWIQRQGPFWEDFRAHDGSEWFECKSEVVTDSAVAEAAWSCLQTDHRALFSVVPSTWNYTPVRVRWVFETGGEVSSSRDVDVDNYWTCSALERELEASPSPIGSWDDLAAVVSRFERLTFLDDAFGALQGHPFSRAAAERILFLLKTLDKLKGCFDSSGNRTSEGHELYQNFFTGQRGGGGRGALFTDSSDSEKNQFRKELTFSHPSNAQETLFCPWHGKVQTPQLRVHFSYPIQADEELYIVYIGPIITKT